MPPDEGGASAASDNPPHRPPALPMSSSSSLSAPAGPIEPINDAAEAYDDDVDFSECYDSGSSASVSVTSSALRTEVEHGRTYQYFKNGRYPIPNDDEEQSREDMKHAMLLELTDGRLFYAPVGDHPQRIIDVGTGTGERPKKPQGHA